MSIWTAAVATKSGPAITPAVSMARVAVSVRLRVAMLVMINMPLSIRPLCLCVEYGKVVSTPSQKVLEEMSADHVEIAKSQATRW